MVSLTLLLLLVVAAAVTFLLLLPPPTCAEAIASRDATRTLQRISFTLPKEEVCVISFTLDGTYYKGIRRRLSFSDKFKPKDSLKVYLYPSVTSTQGVLVHYRPSFEGNIPDVIPCNNNVNQSYTQPVGLYCTVSDLTIWYAVESHQYEWPPPYTWISISGAEMGDVNPTGSFDYPTHPEFLPQLDGSCEHFNVSTLCERVNGDVCGNLYKNPKSYCAQASWDSKRTVCVCFDGYKYSAFQKRCVDVNECAQRMCEPVYETCANAEGTYSCTPSGVVRENTSTESPDITTSASAISSSPSSTVSQNDPSQTCNNGYEWIDEDCVDVNECKNRSKHDCNGLNSVCVNKPGTYECKCLNGSKHFELNGACVRFVKSYVALPPDDALCLPIEQNEASMIMGLALLTTSPNHERIYHEMREHRCLHLVVANKPVPQAFGERYLINSKFPGETETILRFINYRNGLLQNQNLKLNVVIKFENGCTNRVDLGGNIDVVVTTTNIGQTYVNMKTGNQGSLQNLHKDSEKLAYDAPVNVDQVTCDTASATPKPSSQQITTVAVTSTSSDTVLTCSSTSRLIIMFIVALLLCFAADTH